jgi:uncharacterized protein YdaU (DUF1376 family)
MSQKLMAEWFWVDRWTGSSAFLLDLEPRGLYREMLSQAWRRGAELPNDPKSIRKACACTQEEWDRCWPLIERYWTTSEDDKTIFNKTQKEVYAQALQKHMLASDKATNAANARWEKEKRQAQIDTQADAQALREQCPPSPSPSPSLSPSPNPLEERLERFKASILSMGNKYPLHWLFTNSNPDGDQDTRSFFGYWTEKSTRGQKMRFEKEKTWDLNKRLATWAGNQERFNNNRAQEPVHKGLTEW